MAETHPEITPAIADWIAAQRMFFVATAPLGLDGHVNCSPKGLDTFRVLDPSRVGYLDLTGSGAETIAHLRQNGRIVLMFCAFEGAPKIVRLHGAGRVLTPESPEWEPATSEFPHLPGARSLVLVDVTRVSESCGYSVPRYEFVEERSTLERWARAKSPEEIDAYRRDKNAASIDGLPALGPDAAPDPR